MFVSYAQEREQGTGKQGTGNGERGNKDCGNWNRELEQGNWTLGTVCIGMVTYSRHGHATFFHMPGPIRDFRDLVCWQQAIELALLCEDVADALPRKAWKAAQQLRDAADSVHLNIAEGNGRPTLPDYLRHLGIADSSLNEVQSNLYKISRRYPKIPGTAAALQTADRVAKPLYGLIRALKKKMKDGE